MKKFFIFLMLLISITIFAEELKISTPLGNFKMSVSDNGASVKSTVKKVSVVDQIADKLELLNKKYCSKLNRLDQKRAKKIMDEIYDLLAMLPEDIYANVQENTTTEQVQNSTQSQNVNITIKTETTTPIVQDKVVPQNNESKNVMSDAAFQSLYDNVKSESFADDKLSVIKTATKRNYFKVSQLTSILDLFSFEDDKINCVRIMYPKVVDKENAHQILNHFTYSYDKKKVEKIINK